MAEHVKSKLSFSMNLQKIFASNTSIIGLDIDLTSIHLVQLEQNQGSARVIKIVSEPIVVPKDMTQDTATINALKRALSQVNTQSSDVICVLTDPKLVVDHIVLPIMPVEELSQAVKLHVNNAQHYPIDSPISDFQVMGRITDKNIEKFNIMVGVVAKGSLDALIAKFKSPRLDTTAQLRKLLQVESLMDLNITKAIPIGVAIEGLIQTSKISDTAAVFYMGSTVSELNIYRNATLEFSRKINVSGADMTKALTTALFSDSGKMELSVDEAQTLKKEHGVPLPSDNFLIRGKITANQTLSLLRPKLEQINREITRCFDYYCDRNHVKKIDRIILLGEAALLKRYAEVLNAELGIPTVIGNPLEGMEFLAADQKPIDSQAIQSLTVALGASLVKSSSGLNLLPDHFRNLQQKFIQRCLLIVAFVGILFLTSFLYVILMVQEHATKLRLEKAKKAYESLMPQVNGLKNRLLVEEHFYNRANLGDLFMVLSYAPAELSFTELNVVGKDLTLKGVIKANGAHVKGVLNRLITDLSKNALYEIQSEPAKKRAGEKDSYDFKIQAQLIN